MRKHMKLILPFLFALFSLSAFGQISVESDLSQEVDASSARTELKFKVTNTGVAALDFFWEIDRNGCPAEWEFSLCDVNTCYAWGVESCPCSQSSFMAGGDSYDFTIYINPHGVEGVHNIIFRVLQNCDETGSMIAEAEMAWTVAGGSSVNDVDVAKIVLYPNPSSEDFKITDDADIKSIAIYNIVGKNIMNESHIKNQAHDISALDKGFYLVRMMDATQKVLKVLRLTKE